MATAGYAEPARCVGLSVPSLDDARVTPSGNRGAKVWNGAPTRLSFGNVVLVLFLLAQCLDGVFTYVGVTTFGIGVEGNPLIAALMVEFGAGAALIGAKSFASLLGIALHLREVHGAVAGLTLFYGTVALAPWAAVFMMH